MATFANLSHKFYSRDSVTDAIITLSIISVVIAFMSFAAVNFLALLMTTCYVSVKHITTVYIELILSSPYSSNIKWMVRVS